MEVPRSIRHSIKSVIPSLSMSSATGTQWILSGMVFVGFVISGIFEESMTVTLRPDLPTVEHRGTMNDTKERRYCDPPNMTALAIYYDSSEEIDDTDYDFSQLQEMLFEAKLSTEEELESLLKKIYLWGTLISPLPASRLASHIGPKKVFGYSLIGAAAACLLVPAAWLTLAHFGIRFFEGIFHGAMLPAAHMLAVKWFPPHLRSGFVSCYSGSYIGYAMSEMLTKRVVKALGRDAVFYLSSFTALVWFILWSVFVANSSKKRTPTEDGENPKPLKIADKCSSTPESSKQTVPWKHLLGSRPVWMSVGVMLGTQCGQMAVNTSMRQYLKLVYNVNDSYFSAVPFLIHSLFAVICGYIAAFIRKVDFVSNTSCRRMFVYISHFILSGFLFVISFVGCDVTAPIVLYSLAIVTSGAAYAGAYCSALDIAPNFAGTILGLCYTFGAIGRIVTIHFTSLVLDGMVLGSWRITFSLTSLILLLSAIFFMLRGSGSVQIWDDLELHQQEMAIAAIQPTNKYSMDSPDAILKGKHKYNVEKKILKVLHVQQPDKFTRVRAYSTSSPYRSSIKSISHVPGYCDKKRASIS